VGEYSYVKLSKFCAENVKLEKAYEYRPTYFCITPGSWAEWKFVEFMEEV
jgi:hypothetical protein